MEGSAAAVFAGVHGLLFPHIHAEIDWTRPYELLDKEFQQVVRDATTGRRLVDLLVRVWLVSGEDLWVLVHVEVQRGYEAGFAERLYVYNYRIYDRFERDVVTLAVLADERATWRPTHYMREHRGCAIQFTYPSIKLLDYREQRAALEASTNPFATVVLAHLDAQGTRSNAQRRRQAKLALTRRLYTKGYDRQEIMNLYRFIDWLLELPDNEEKLFVQEITQFEEEHRMPHITAVERLSLEKGRQEALQGTIRRTATRKFGSMPAILETRLRETTQTDDLEAILDRVIDATTVEDLL